MSLVGRFVLAVKSNKVGTIPIEQYQEKDSAVSTQISPNKPMSMFESAKIAVVGIGGAGCNSITRMQREHIKGIKLISMDTDKARFNQIVKKLTQTL
jgi:cell division GTPase FtsZ